MGLIAASAVFFPLNAKRRARIPLFAWWLCLIVGVVACGYGLSHSTAPSFATRITAVGRTYNYVERQYGRDTFYGFRFVPNGGEPVNVETEIIIPGWANPSVFDGRIFRVVYLVDDTRAMKNEAIDIEILSGRDAGYHHSLDARPLGTWLGIPLGSAFGSFGFFGLRYRKDDTAPATSDDDITGYTSSLFKS
jgi:hypothetical protein